MSKQSTPRLLVADDDLGVVASYRHVLEGHWQGSQSRNSASSLDEELFGAPVCARGAVLDWSVLFVDQGEDAVAAVRRAAAESEPFSVAFLDIRMPPGIDGRETAKRIRNIDPDVHIVFVSGFSDYTEDELTEVAGPRHKVSFLTKPVWPDELRAMALGRCRETQMLALLKKAHRERCQELVKEH